MDEDELRRTLRRIIDEEIKPTFLQMLKESEHRIDETNKMIQRLAEMQHSGQGQNSSRAEVKVSGIVTPL